MFSIIKILTVPQEILQEETEVHSLNKYLFIRHFLGVSNTVVNTIHKGSAFKRFQSKGSEELTHPE